MKHSEGQVADESSAKFHTSTWYTQVGQNLLLLRRVNLDNVCQISGKFVYTLCFLMKELCIYLMLTVLLRSQSLVQLSGLYARCLRDG